MTAFASANSTKKDLRHFGLLVGGVFLLIGFLPLFWHDDIRLWAVVVGAALIAGALLFPALLAFPYRGWMTVGHLLGWINTRILLGILFYCVFTPIALIRRLVGIDPMGRRFDRNAVSYRIPAHRRDAKHMEHPF